MRKLIITFIISLFVLTACQGNEPEETELGNEEAIPPEEETADITEEQEEEEIVQEEEKEQEKLYFIAEDSSVQPLHEGVEENVVLLTIDDAPNQYALEMAETLKKLDVNAIFFVNGHFLNTTEDEEKLKRIHEMGFEIGNHTYNHPLLPDIPENEQREEIIGLNDRIEEIIGERPKFFRAPNGKNTDYSREIVEEEEMVLMNWTYGYDYFDAYMDAEKLAEAMITGEGPDAGEPYSLLKPGANLLMHDREWTNEALETIVNGLREQGYEIVDPALIQTITEENSAE